VGDERGVGSARKGVIGANGAAECAGCGHDVSVLGIVPVRTAGAPEHSARAHRRVPPRRAPTSPRARRGRLVVGGPGAGPRATAESSRATTPAARHEEVRVRLVRRATRARQTAGHPDEHAQPAIRIHLRPPPERAATLRRAHTRVTRRLMRSVVRGFFQIKGKIDMTRYDNSVLYCRLSGMWMACYYHFTAVYWFTYKYNLSNEYIYS